jgi:pimeloyl-ACP methyl ester carboxylesterase
MSGGPGTIRNASGERLDYTFTAAVGQSDDTAPGTAVILAHGVTAHKDRPWLGALSTALSHAGLASLRLSFAGNGASEGRYEDAWPSKEVDDLRHVVDALERWGVSRIAYVGHSMGGAVGVLTAAREPRIRALVSLAGMVRVRWFFETHFSHLAPGEPMLEKPECPWSPALLEDARRIDTVLPQAAQIEVPWLLVHGDADELVPYQDAVDAVAAAGGRPTLVTLRGIDHRFTGAVPQMVEAVVEWLTGGTEVPPAQRPD